MASPFLSALASIGSQYAEGRTAGQEEKEKIAQEKARTGLEQTQQQLERQRLNLQMQQLADYQAESPLRAAQAKAAAAKANFVDVYDSEGKKHTWDVSKGKIVGADEMGMADPTTASNFQQAQAYISGQPKEIQPELNRRLTFGYATREPWDKLRTSLEGMVDKYSAQQGKGGGGAGAADLVSGLPQAVKGNWDQDISDKFQRRVQWLLTHSKNPGAEIDRAYTEADAAQRLRAADKAKAAKEAAKGQELTAGASKAIYTTMPTVAQANDLIKDIDKLGLANNHTRMYLLKPYALYRLGDHGPTPTLAKDIAGFSLGSLTEAVSALGGSTRAYAALQIALIHTPNAMTDSPAQMREKLIEIRTRLNRIIGFARLYGTKGATPPLDQALRAVGTPENEIQMLMGQLGQAGAARPSADTGIPAPVAAPNTDVAQPAAAGGLSPAAQQYLNSVQPQKKGQ